MLMIDNEVAKVSIQSVRKSGPILLVFLTLSTKRIISSTAVIANIVFVAAISGECRTGTSPQIIFYPANTSRAKLVTKEIVRWSLVISPLLFPATTSFFCRSMMKYVWYKLIWDFFYFTIIRIFCTTSSSRSIFKIHFFGCCLGSDRIVLEYNPKILWLVKQ